MGRWNGGGVPNYIFSPENGEILLTGQLVIHS